MTSTPTAPLLTAADASRAVDGRVTPAGFRAAAARGRLRVAAKTVGGVHLFFLDDVVAYLESRRPRGAR